MPPSDDAYLPPPSGPRLARRFAKPGWTPCSILAAISIALLGVGLIVILAGLASVCRVPTGYPYTDARLRALPAWQFHYPQATLVADRYFHAGSDCNLIEYAAINPGYAERRWGTDAPAAEVIDWYRDRLLKDGWALTETRDLVGNLGDGPSFSAYRGHGHITIYTTDHRRYVEHVYVKATPYPGDTLLNYATVFESDIEWNIPPSGVTMPDGSPAPSGAP